jgi:hypothetical protein
MRIARLERQVFVRHHVGSSVDRRSAVRITAQLTLWRLVAAALFTPLVILVLAERTYESNPGTRTAVDAYAFEAFPQWATVNHEEACPRSIHDLTAYVATNPHDEWGTELELHCGNGIRGALVRSAGPDRRFGSADDISSNDPR